MAVWPFIITRLNKTEIAPVDINHEKIHFRQQVELLLLGFYIWYSIEFLINFIKYRNGFKAYLAISFEKEAYKNEANQDYLHHRKSFSWFKFYFNENKKG